MVTTSLQLTLQLPGRLAEPSAMLHGPASHPSDAFSAEQCAECARLRGCQACFEELVRRFQSSLLHYLLRRVKSRDDAEDLLQETFLIAYRKLGSYRTTW